MVHPYLEVIQKSKSFTDQEFWRDISTYLDLEGVYYLLAIRATGSKTMKGNIQEFKLLNPYDITRVLNSETLKVEGYIENRLGYQRELPAEMIIEMRELNPFSADDSYSMMDAAKESQFTIKTASDYTRNALRNNINAPGIISTDIVLEGQLFKNFTERVKGKTKGEPIFANGANAVKWTPMTSDLKDSGLNTVAEINREQLFSVSGVSKTVMGIEQSGTTRETANVQKELLIEGHIVPRIQLILDALNQDYRNNAPTGAPEATLIVDDPFGTDFDAETKEVAVETTAFDLYQKMIDEGYDSKKVAKYVKGEIDISEVGDADPAKKKVFTPPPLEDLLVERLKKKVNHSRSIIGQQEGALQNAVVNIDEQLVAAAMKRVKKKSDNAISIDGEGDLITKTEKKDAIQDLTLVLSGFYSIVMLLKGNEVMRDRMGEFALAGSFTIDKKVKKYVEKVSKKVANSHIDTIADDVFRTAQKAALEGLSQEQIIQKLKDQYSSEIVEGRAKVIARTETNRAFTRAQFEADNQFVDQNDLKSRAFKQWRTRSANPCDFCQSLEDEGPIPLDDSFRDIGSDIIVGKGDDKKVLEVSFESLEAGNAHPNCNCDYELIIEEE